MSIAFRFGSQLDSNDVVNGDQHVPEHILNWKLQNQEIVLAKDDEDLIGYLRLEYLWLKYRWIRVYVRH